MTELDSARERAAEAPAWTVGVMGTHSWLVAPASTPSLECDHGAVSKATANPRVDLQPRENFHGRFLKGTFFAKYGMKINPNSWGREIIYHLSIYLSLNVSITVMSPMK